MILKFLKNNHSYLVILFFSFSFLFFAPYYFTLSPEDIEVSSILTKILLITTNLIIICFHSIGLNNLIYQKDVIKKQNFILPFVFMLIQTSFLINTKTILYSFALLFFLNYLLSLYKQRDPFSNVFNAGLIISSLSILGEPEILCLFILIPISMIIFRNLNWRSLVILLISIPVPYCFIWTYQNLLDMNIYFPNFNFKFIVISNSILNQEEKIWFIVLCLISLISLYELFRWLYKKSIRSRESFSIILFYFITSIILFLLTNKIIFIGISLSPLSVIIANYFAYSKKNTLSNLLFIILFFSAIFYRISTINI